MHTGKRREVRIPAVLPVTVMGTDEDGKSVRVQGWTVDVSAGGARLVGLPPLRRNDLVSIMHGEKKGRFHVVWVGGRGSLLVGQMSVRAVDPDNWIWSIPRPQKAVPDLFREGRQRSAAEESWIAEHKQELAKRVAEMTGDLRSLETLIQAEELDPRLLKPFREAANYAAQALAAVQGWLELEVARKDPFDMLTPLTLGRLRLACDLNRELTSELEGADLPFSQEEVMLFSRSLRECSRRIVALEGQSRGVGLGGE